MTSTKAKKKAVVNKRKRIRMRIFTRIEPNSCGSIQVCATTINMPSPVELEEIFKDRPSKPIPKAVDRYMDRMMKIDIRPKPDLYDLMNIWKAK